MGYVGTILINAARETFGMHRNPLSSEHNKTTSKKPWFNNDCRTARTKYHLAKKMHNRHKTLENKAYLAEMSKAYKKTIDTCVREYRSALTNKLTNLRSTNPKDYWKILNSGNKDKKCAVDIEDMYNFMKEVNNADPEDHIPNSFNPIPVRNETQLISDDLLNTPIREEEIIEAVQKLKKGKAPGFDSILNEHISSSLNIFLPIYLKFFNIIYDSGTVPEEWLIGLIKPIYKNKGDPMKPENYRPITLLSCLGKVFTCILNKRLETFADEVNLLKENQSGFRKNYSTLDHIFTLHFLSNILLQRKKKLFCAFVDFKQAFDTVWRNGLWTKMHFNGVSGKCLQYIQNMYKGIKSMLKINGMLSEFFNCNIGVRQGENLSPFLFSLYINDLEEFLVEKNVLGIHSISNDIENELFIF